MDNFKQRLKTSLVVDQPEGMDDVEWAYREDLVQRCSAGLRSMGLGFPLAVVEPLMRFLKGELDQDELAQHLQERPLRKLH
jgi:hypothetical protein